MSTSKSKPGNTKTQAKIAQTTYIQEIIGSSKKADVPVTKESIDIVKSVYNWPDEDIVRVLQDCHNDAQVAINRIVDGTFKEPEQWNEVHTKPKKEHKEQKQPRQQRQRDRGSSGQDNEANGDKHKNQRPRENGDSEGHRRQQGRKGPAKKGGNRQARENGKGQGKNESEAPNHTPENQPQASETNAPKQQEAPQQPQVPEVKPQQNQEQPQKQKQAQKEQKRPSEPNPPQQPKPATISYAQKLQQSLHQQQAKPYQPQDFPPVQSHAQSHNQPHPSHEPQQLQPSTPSQPQSQPSQPSQSQPQQPLPQTSASASSASQSSAPANNAASSSIAQQQARTAYHPPGIKAESYVWKPKETKEATKEPAPVQATQPQPVQQPAPVHVQQPQPVVQKQEPQQPAIQPPSHAPQPVQPPVQTQQVQTQARPNSFYSAPVILPPRSVQALDQTKINVQFGAFDDPRPVQSSQQTSVTQKPTTPPSQFVQPQQLEHSAPIDQQAVDYSQQQATGVDGHVSGMEQNFQVPPLYIPGHPFLPPFPQPYYTPEADPLRNPNMPVYDPNFGPQPAFREPSPEASKFSNVHRTGSQNAPNADQFKQGNFASQEVQGQNAQGTTQPTPSTHPYGPYSAPYMYHPYINQYPYSIPSTSQNYGYPPKFFRPGYFPQPSANTNNVNFSAEELANTPAYQAYQPFFPFDIAMMGQQQQQQQQQPKANQPAQQVPANQSQKTQGYGQPIQSAPQQPQELAQGSNQPYKPQQFQGRENTFYNSLNNQPNQFAQQSNQASSFGYPVNPYRNQFQ